MRGSGNISMKVRNTKQRQAIFEAIEHHGGHLTADEIYRLVKRRFPRLSLGTVYRNLRVLVARGGLQSVAGQAHNLGGFRIEEHRLDFIGVCAACQSKPGKTKMSLRQIKSR